MQLRFILYIAFFFLLFSKGMAAQPDTTGHSTAGVGQMKRHSIYTIVIDKSDFELSVYEGEELFAVYAVVFGSKDQSDKMRQGDKLTPNGTYSVILKKIHTKWGPELLLDYPLPEDVDKFKERKKNGLIPKNAIIGDGIAIHGTRPEEEWTVDNQYNWTDGCISLKYSEMKDLYEFIEVGTKVTIQP